MNPKYSSLSFNSYQLFAIFNNFLSLQLFSPFPIHTYSFSYQMYVNAMYTAYKHRKVRRNLHANANYKSLKMELWADCISFSFFQFSKMNILCHFNSWWEKQNLLNIMTQRVKSYLELHFPFIFFSLFRQLVGSWVNEPELNPGPQQW